MKIWIIITFLLGIVPISKSQAITTKQQLKLDSLNAIITDISSHDTAVVSGLLSLVDCYYLSNPDTALVFCKRAEILSEKINYKRGKGDTYGWLGYLHSNKGDKTLALNYHLKSLKVCTEIGDKNGVALSLNNVGGIYNRQGDTEKGMEYYEQSMKIRKEIGDKKGIAQGLNNIGHVYKKHGQVNKGLKFIQRSLKIYEEIGDKIGMASIFNNLGLIYKNYGDIKLALDYLHKSLKLREETGDKEGVAESLNNLGSICNNQGDKAEAIKYYQRGFEIYKELGDKRGIALSLNSLGHFYNGNGELGLGLEYFHKSLKILEEISYMNGIAALLNNIGAIYSRQKEFIKALEYYQKSLKIRQEQGDKKGVAHSLSSISYTYFINGQLAKAENYAKKSLKLSQELGYPFDIRNASKMLHTIYSKSGNYSKALSMFELFIQMRDSINNEETHKAAIKQEMLYEYEKKSAADSIKSTEQQMVMDAQILAQEAQLSQERTFKYSLFCGLGLVALFAIFIMNRLNITRKQKREIELKNSALNERNAEIAHQKELVEHKNKEVLDSITYAERIQSAILPPKSLFQQSLPDSFIIYKPKDIVAGDFYWMELQGETDVGSEEAPQNEMKSNIIYFSAADCTGHGVPGAMMSVMCSNALTKCVKELGLTKPGEILDATTKIIEGTFERSEKLVLDGMDVALCKLDIKSLKLQFSGANNPLWIVRSGELLETVADKQPIGQYDNRKPYTNHQIQLYKGDSIYIFSDGIIDQFGGPKGEKLKSKPLKNMLLSIQENLMVEQKKIIEEDFEMWKGDLEQVDDVCMIGVRV